MMMGDRRYALEQLRYAPVASKAASRQQLATLGREFNHLAWPDR